jgi:polar amino acid transport system permease protein
LNFLFLDEPAAPTLSDYLPLLLQGVPVTLEATFAAMVLVVASGFAFGLGRSSKTRFLRLPAGFAVEVLRGSSAIAQLFWAFYVLPYFGVELSPFVAGVAVLGLNGGAYFSEVVRAAFASVPKGQTEAAIALNLSAWFRLRRIILPQALPLMVPPFGNALIDMLKFTALLSLVTIQELAYRADAIRSVLAEAGPVYGIALLLYFAMSLSFAAIVQQLERLANRWAGRPDSRTRGERARSSAVPRWAFPGR